MTPDADDVLAGIDRDELAELTLTMANIASPSPHEAAMAEFLGSWLSDNGFSPRSVALVTDRPNVMAVLRGEGDGPSLLFNSHMDTSISAGDRRLRNPDDPIYHSGWRQGDVLHGHGVMNDKGPMAAWMLACRAIKDAGVPLRGDIVMTMVVGETGSEPVDEFQDLAYLGKDAGARHLAVHGGIADFVLVAEATDFALGWVEAGKVFCKVSVHGDTSLYTPFVQPGRETSALLRARHVLNCWDEWAAEYTRRHRYECAGGVVEPRANIGAIRAGLPYNVTRTPEVCELYVDLRTSPGQSPTGTVSELRRFLQDVGVEADVEPFLFRPGHEARGVDPLVRALTQAHQRVIGSSPGIAGGPTTSMWRDSNVWNELGIPAAMYGPGGGTGGGGRQLLLDDLHRAARVYALTALGIAG